MRVLGALGVLVGKYVDGVVLRVVFSVGCCWGAEIGSLCEALWLCGDCGMGGGMFCLVKVLQVLWFVLYG